MPRQQHNVSPLSDWHLQAEPALINSHSFMAFHMTPHGME